MHRRTALKFALGFLAFPKPALAGFFSRRAGEQKIRPPLIHSLREESHIKDKLVISSIQVPRHEKMLLEGSRLDLLYSVTARLERLKRIVGYGNFSLLSFDDALRFARNYSEIGAFNSAELNFLEEVFFEDARRYGFYGSKVTTQLGAHIPKREIVKVPRTGHYLFKGEPLEMYKKVRREVGDSLVLTSGIRSVVKQMHLFLAKTISVGGSLSEASYSLAPPGHSYHGIGDFDVGKVGLGAANFTEKFAKTDEFKRLIDLGYVLIRYPDINPYGVRYEPWHIKVV